LTPSLVLLSPEQGFGIMPDNLTYDKVGSALQEFLISSKFILCS
jgi:hypothetical protein